jgi:choice-of-anchor A domain-containing protein
MMRNTLRCPALAVSTLLFFLNGHANATPLTGDQIINAFDLVAVNASTTSEVRGPVLVLGTLSGNGFLDAQNIPVRLPGYSQVNIGNNTGTWVEGSSQSVAISGTNTGSFLGTTPQTGVVFPDTPASIMAALQTYSAGLAALPATGTYDPSTGVFSGPAGAVFDLATAPTKPIVGLQDGDIVNVAATSWTDTQNYLTGDALWNFFNATTLTINIAFDGYILAPNANALLNTAPVNGLAVESYIGEGEIHPSDLDAPPLVHAAEPRTLLLFAIVTFSLIGGWSTWRRGEGQQQGII